MNREAILLEVASGFFLRFAFSGGLMKPNGHFHPVECLLATDLEVTVLPPNILVGASILRGTPLAFDQELRVTEWCGVACAVTMVTLRAVVLPSAVFRNFTFPVLIPTQTHSWFPSEMLIGANFLERFAAEVGIVFSQPGDRFSLPDARIWLL